MPEAAAPPKPATPAYTGSHPFPGKLLVNCRLSGPESEKDTRQFELDLKGWGLRFEVGDSVAIYATDDPALVDEILHVLGAKCDAQVSAAKSRKRLREA